MKAKFLILFCALFMPLLAMSQYAGPYAYVSASTLSLRERPSSSASVLKKLSKYDVVELRASNDNVGDWVKCRYLDGEYYTTGYVNRKYIVQFENDPLEKSTLHKKELKLLTAPKADIAGFIEFSFQNGMNNCDINMHIWIPSWRKHGGSGTVDAGQYLGNLTDGQLEVFESPYPVVYDKKAGLLYCLGYLWKLPK